uniref:E3 ubiquitin-protein ligase TRIM21 n=1 Tax=Schistocephalus solidus TaxID=70667 RepID=A0A0X3PQ11_SCHSO
MQRLQLSARDFNRLAACSVCLERLTDPWVLPCQHYFCYKPCLEELLKENSNHCPNCRAQFERSQLKPFYFFRNLISLIKPTSQTEYESVASSEIETEWQTPVNGEEWTSRSIPISVPEEDVVPAASTDTGNSQTNMGRRCPRWASCVDRNCNFVHPTRFCMNISCPGGDSCNLLHVCDIPAISEYGTTIFRRESLL